jgi:hypothetical protein
MDNVNWYHIRIALTSIFKKSKSDFSRFMKFKNSTSNTGAPKKLFTEKPKTAVTASEKCSCCKNETETTMHLFTFPHKEIHTAITTSIDSLVTPLQKFKIPLDMWFTIRACMGSFLGRDYEMPTSTGHHKLSLQQEYNNQTSIGWGNFLKGHITDT